MGASACFVFPPTLKVMVSAKRFEISSAGYRILPETRKLIFRFHSRGFSALKISNYLAKTHNPVAVLGVRIFIKKFRECGHFEDLPRIGRPKKLDQRIREFIDKETEANLELEEELLARTKYIAPTTWSNEPSTQKNQSLTNIE